MGINIQTKWFALKGNNYTTDLPNNSIECSLLPKMCLADGSESLAKVGIITRDVQWLKV